MNILRVAFVLVLILLQGCASAVGWGKMYEIVQSNPKSVTIEYDSVICNYNKVAAAAEAEAAKYGKVAVVRGMVSERSQTIFGGIQTVVFDLVNP